MDATHTVDQLRKSILDLQVKHSLLNFKNTNENNNMNIYMSTCN